MKACASSCLSSFYRVPPTEHQCGRRLLSICRCLYMDFPLQQPGDFKLPPKLVLHEEQQRSRHEGKGTNSSRQSAKKGEPWTEEEHLAFLQGLARLGKGQWKSIAKYYVPSRTATQVASHAQKHFLRVSGSTKRRSRFSAVEEATMATPSAPVSAARDASRTFPLLPQQQQQPMQQPLSLQPSAACVLGQPVAGSVVMGIPLGMPPWLPPPISQQAASLPILPVGPMSPAQELAQHAEEPSPPSSRDSRGTGSPARPLRSSGSSHGRASTRPRTLPRPTSRQQQLFRLLEMREQMHASSHAKAQPAGSAGSAAAALRGATPTPPPALYSTAAVQPQQPSSSQARSEHGSLAKRKLQPVTEAAAEPSVEQRQPAARPVPPLWGAMPEGLAMLAAAACNNGAGGEAGAKDLDGCHTTETDSETDTTGCERSTM